MQGGGTAAGLCLAPSSRTQLGSAGARAPYLVHLVHVVLRVSSGPLGWDGVSCRGRPRAGPHHAVGGARRGPRARTQHGSRGGARARGGAWPRSSTQRWVRRGHLHPSCGQGSPAGKRSWSGRGSPPPPGRVRTHEGGAPSHVGSTMASRYLRQAIHPA